MIAMDLNDPARPITRFFTSTARPNGAWSRAGLAWAFDSLFVQTADGVWNPPEGLWGQTLLRLAPKTLQVLDYFTPANLEELNANDLVHGAYGISQDSIVLTEALELEHLDYEEFLAAYESMTLALASHLREFATYREGR